MNKNSVFCCVALAATGLSAGENSSAVTGAVERVENGVLVLSTADGSLQPVRFLLPETAKGKKVPLLVALHTWSYGFDSESPWKWAREQCLRRGWALVYPHFRGPNWTPEGCGSDLAVQDVLDAVAYARSHADIDDDRIYLIGGSGGGHMSLLMAGRHPEVWAGVYAACPITDIARWHEESVVRKRGYAGHLVKACGGLPAEKPEEYRHRSPLTWLAAARKTGTHIQIATGVHDGHYPGSVPIGHSVRAFNLLADAEAAISEADIAFIEEREAVPEALRFDGQDPFFNEQMRIHLRRTSANVRFTLFEGGHAGNFEAGIDWLARQRRGRSVDWTLPEKGEGRAEAVTR